MQENTLVVEAQVVTKSGESADPVTFKQVNHGVVVTAQLENLPENPHDFHLRETEA